MFKAQTYQADTLFHVLILLDDFAANLALVNKVAIVLLAITIGDNQSFRLEQISIRVAIFLDAEVVSGFCSFILGNRDFLEIDVVPTEAANQGFLPSVAYTRSESAYARGW